MTENSSIHYNTNNSHVTQDIAMELIPTQDFVYEKSKIFPGKDHQEGWKIYDGDINGDGNHDIAYVRYANPSSGTYYISDFKLFSTDTPLSSPLGFSDYFPTYMPDKLKKQIVKPYCISKFYSDHHDRLLANAISNRNWESTHRFGRLAYGLLSYDAEFSRLTHDNLTFTGYINPDYCNQWESSKIVYREKDPNSPDIQERYLDLDSLSILEMSDIDNPYTIYTLTGILPFITLHLGGTIY